MAERAAVSTTPNSKNVSPALTVTWEEMTESDTAETFEKPRQSDVCVHVQGTFAGGTISIEGSNSLTGTFLVLKDMEGQDLTFTEAGINTVRDNVQYIRPKTPAGSGMDIDVFMTMRGGGGPQT